MENSKDYINNQDDSINNDGDYYIEKGITETKAYGLEDNVFLYSIKKALWLLPVYDTLTGRPLFTKDEGESKLFLTYLELAVLDRIKTYQVYHSVCRHRNRYRQGTVSTKTRSEVQGGGRKPYQQKGTGRARAGSNSSPLWNGGGLSFGPKPRDYNSKLNKDELELAVRTVLYNRLSERFVILRELEKAFINAKTKDFIKVVSQIRSPINNPDRRPVLDMNQSILIIVTEKTDSLILATQNLQDVELVLATELNVVSLLEAAQCIVSYDAYEVITETYFQCKFFNECDSKLFLFPTKKLPSV